MGKRLLATPQGKVPARDTFVPQMRKLDAESVNKLKQAYVTLMGRPLSDDEFRDIEYVEKIVNGRFIESEDVEIGKPKWKQVNTGKGMRKRLLIHPIDKMRLRREYGIIFTTLREQSVKDIYDNIVNAARTLSKSIEEANLRDEPLRDKAYVLDVVSRNMEVMNKIAARSGTDVEEITSDDVVTLEETIIRRILGSPAAIQKLSEKRNTCTD